MITTDSTSFPYDARNTEDFDALTKRIDAGLLALRSDPKLKPTEETLADLAKCSRGTLRNRKWPIEALRAMKLERRSTKPPAAASPAKPEPQKASLRAHADQLKLARDETLRWKMKHDELLQGVATLSDAVECMKASEARLRAEVIELRACIAQGAGTGATVVPIGHKKGPPRS